MRSQAAAGAPRGGGRGLVIAAPASGAGKTTVTLGLVGALRARGLVVQPFKAGPDFIDPGHLTRAAGRPARNLDSWLTDPGYLRALAARASHGADVAVVEGMMGLFDGVDGTSDRGSTAEIAALLDWPVVLVVEASAAARSVGALVHGFRTFSRDVEVAAVVFNRVAGPGHTTILADACAQTGVAVLGGLAADSSLAIAERHLGLHGALEPGAPQDYGAFARAVASALDLERALALARPGRVAAQAGAQDEPATQAPSARCRIAVARDAAFAFYYEDNLELLRAAGAGLVEWSPLESRSLPPGIDGLYLGGGYPELHARRLEAAAALRREVRDFAARGGMIYAECGGFMYLQRAIRLTDGSEAEMAGLFPGVAAMQPGLVALGYREQAMTVDGRTLTVRGQEFRHSRLEEWPERATVDGEEVRLADPAGRDAAGGGMLAWRRVLAGYTHLHFGSAPGLAELLVARAAAFRGERG